MKKDGVKLVLIFVILFLLIQFVSFVSAQTYSVNVTNEHPFLLSNGSYIPASQLQVGMQLMTIDGKKATVSSITDVHSDSSFPVYNLEADPFSNFVLPGGVVVHNSNGLAASTDSTLSCDCIVSETTKINIIIEDSPGSEKAIITTMEGLNEIYSTKGNSNIYILGESGNKILIGG